MKTKKNLSNLSLKIQKIKELSKELKRLEQKENDQGAGTISQLLKIMSSLFEEVDQRLTELETNHE
jgi:phage host-nuclease inhibitor protein Gam